MKKIYLFSCVLLVVFCSCTRYYYAPNMHNVTLFRDKGEARLSGGLSAGSEISSYEVQAAYSLTNHIGVMANYFNARSEDGPNNGRGHLTEVAVGYFKPLKRNEFIFELYGGYGRGKVINNYDPDEYSELGLDKLFLQPSIGYTVKDYFDVAVSSRIGYVNYSSLMSIGTTSSAFSDINYIRDHRQSVMLEPALTVRGGWKYIKLQLQAGYSFNMSHADFKQEKANYAISAYFSFAKRFRKK